MKNIAIAVGIALSLIMSFLGFNRPAEVIVEKQPVVGAIAGPDISSPYVSWGGVRNWAGMTESLTQASTTVCAIQAPAATSTLELGSGIRLDVSSTTASRVVVAKATTPYATTTFLFGANVAANAEAAVVATTSADAFVFAPNTYMVVSLTGGTGTFSPTGACQASWTQI